MRKMIILSLMSLDSSTDGCCKRRSPSPSAVSRTAHVITKSCVHMCSHGLTPAKDRVCLVGPHKAEKEKGVRARTAAVLAGAAGLNQASQQTLPTDQQPLKHPPRSLKSQNPRQSVSQSVRAHSSKNNGLTALAPPGCPAAHAQAVSARGLGAGDPRAAGPGEGFQASDE